jgi:hypothetical protein
MGCHGMGELQRQGAVGMESPEADHTETIPAGRIVHDERGNALWKWRGDTSSTDSTSGILKYIDPADLAVEGGEPGRPGETPPGVTDSRGGYDPYNQGRPRRK